MYSSFRTKYQNYILKTDKYVCNKFGLAEFAVNNFDKIMHDVQGDVLDVGCGSGPIGIFLADNFNCSVTAVDINETACECCRENIEKYSLNDYISVYSKDFVDFCKTNSELRFDIIISNPPVDEEVPFDVISKYSEQTELSDGLFSYLTNSWHSMDGLDLSDYIFLYAQHNLKENGCVIIIFCDIDCRSTEYIINKAVKCGFFLKDQVDGIIAPHLLGVDDFIKSDIKAHILKFKKGDQYAD